MSLYLCLKIETSDHPEYTLHQIMIDHVYSKTSFLTLKEPLYKLRYRLRPFLFSIRILQKTTFHFFTGSFLLQYSFPVHVQTHQRVTSLRCLRKVVLRGHSYRDILMTTVCFVLILDTLELRTEGPFPVTQSHWLTYILILQNFRFVRVVHSTDQRLGRDENPIFIRVILFLNGPLQRLGERRK